MWLAGAIATYIFLSLTYIAIDFHAWHCHFFLVTSEGIPLGTLGCVWTLALVQGTGIIILQRPACNDQVVIVVTMLTISY